MIRYNMEYDWFTDLVLFLQILVSTAQQRQALNEVEQRHREIMALEQDIRV